MKTKYYIFLTFILSLFLYTNCSKEDYIDLEPISALQVNELLKSADGVTQLTNGAYGYLGMPYNWILGLLNDQMSDDAWAERFPEYDDLGQIPTGASRLMDSYRGFYNGIVQCNLVINKTEEQMENYSGSDKEIVRMRQGEAYFLRAMMYFDMVRTWGEVPLITEYFEDPFKADKPRSSIQDIYSQIKSDINAAIERLPEKSETDNWRANLGAAYTLKAKVHLTLEEWGDAVTACDYVINNLNYNLVSTDDYGTLWGENMAENSNSETIFEIEYEGMQATGSEFNHVTHSQAMLPTDANNTYGYPGSSGDHTIMQAFEPGDSIREYYCYMQFEELPDAFQSKRKPGINDYVNRKHFIGYYTEWGNGPENHVKFRYAEVLLMKAEAQNELGEGDPIALLNQIRNRVELSDYTGPADKASVRQTIRHERRVEFCWEQKRLFDLNRWGILLDNLRDQTGLSNMSDKHFGNHPITGKNRFYLKIPEQAIELNANLDAMHGY